MRTHESLINALEYVVADRDPRVYSSTRKNGMFYYVPLKLQDFDQQLSIAITACGLQGIDKPKFIDVGCGIGSKVLVALSVGCNAYGVEYDPEYVEKARRLLEVGTYLSSERAEKRIIHDDAMNLDYSEYDIIYFYCPFADHEKERELEQHLVSTARPGALILANNKQDSNLWGSSGLLSLDGGRDRWASRIFQKQPRQVKVA